MKKNFYSNYSLKLIIILDSIIYILLIECSKDSPILKNNNECVSYCDKNQFISGECEITIPFLKAKWLNNIITFENTNKFYLTLNDNANIMAFTATSIDKKERIYYSIKFGEIYFLSNETDNNVPYIKRKIEPEESFQMTNIDSCIINLNHIYYLSIGNENSYIQLFVFDQNLSNEPNKISPSSFFNDNFFIKGINSLCYIVYSNYLIYVAITSNEDDSSDYFLSFYYILLIPQEKSLFPSIKSNKTFDIIKGKYASCSSILSFPFVSCFYINKENNYVASLFLRDEKTFTQGNTLFVDSYNETDSDENKIYFFKHILVNKNFLIFAYYSGEFNEVPTFIFKKLDNNNVFSDMYNNLPIVHLYKQGYSFNNKLEYNEIVKTDTSEFLFISTNENKDSLIIAELKLFESSVTHERELSIRYIIIELKKYYNMKILNGLKAVHFNNFFLTLALDFCLYDSCDSNNNIGNSGLIKFSYSYKKNNEEYIDFIEYSFNNNIGHVIIDLIENIEIENNIFGLDLERIIAENENQWNFHDGIKYYLVNSGEDFAELQFTYPNDTIINVTFSEYSFDKINIKMTFVAVFSSPKNALEYNKYFDDFNDTYGSISDESSYKLKKITLPYFYYFININEDLSTSNCNDTNCSLCLRNDTDYCLVCKGEYTIINNTLYTYGKKKYCIKDYIELNIEDFLNGKYKDKTLSKEELKKLYKEFKDFIIEEYNGKNTIIKAGNVDIQISNIDAQKYAKDLSNIELGKCGEILKNKYCKNDNDSLIMLKFDIRPENEKSTYVQYEIYDPDSKTFLKLEECIDSNITIDIPLELDNDLELLYYLLSRAGYNLFNSSDSFYNEICATFTTQNGTDILLYDRRMDIYQSTVNVALCQEGCEFKSYNIENKKAKCNCKIEKKEKEVNIDLDEIEFDKNKMLDEFYETLENSNFRVLKCYKLVFNLKIFKTNIGSIIMLVLLFIFLCLIIFNIFTISKQINIYIIKILREKMIKNNKKEEKNEKKKNNNSNNKNSNNKDDEKLFSLKLIKANDHNKPNSYEKRCLPKITKKKKKVKRKKRKLTTNFTELNYNLGNEIRILKKNNTIIINDKPISLINNTDKKNEPPRKKKHHYSDKSSVYFLNKSSNNKCNKNDLIQSNCLNLDLSENKTNAFNRNDKNDKNDNSYPINIFTNIKSNMSLKETIKNKVRKHSNLLYASPKKPKKKVSFFQNNMNPVINNNLNASNLKEQISEKSDDTNIKKEELYHEKIHILNNEELNSLKYKEALELDKRTYFQYYVSLLFKKQLILFSFCPANDYNIISLKITLFIVSFSLYFTINGFFFNDKTMHKIYKDNGAFNIAYQIPQILYSSFVTTIINMILKNLSLSERDMLKIKQQKDVKITVELSKDIKRCIFIKFGIFIFISLLLMLFFWYFISCFCAVYNNTQIILFKDTLLSFGLSMLYPIGFSLIPGIFRIPSLRSEKKNKKCLYHFSQIIALL